MLPTRHIPAGAGNRPAAVRLRTFTFFDDADHGVGAVAGGEVREGLGRDHAEGAADHGTDEHRRRDDAAAEAGFGDTQDENGRDCHGPEIGRVVR